MRRFMQLALYVLLQAIRDLSRHCDNASKSFDLFCRRNGCQAYHNQKRSVRHVTRSSNTDIVSLPWRSGCARGAGPGGGANHRAGGARDRSGRLCLLLLHHVDGRVPQAIYKRRTRQGSLQGSDEHVRQRARIPAGRLQGCRALQLRYALFRFLAGHDQGARRHFGSGY